jgi:hypothetical protein
MMDESSELYNVKPNPFLRVSDYSVANAPVTNLNMDEYREGGESNSKRRKMLMVLIIGVAIIASYLAFGFVSSSKKVDSSSLRAKFVGTGESPYATSSDPAAAPKNKDSAFDDGMVCIPVITFKQELFAESIPQVASDEKTVVIKHGKRLDYFDESRTKTSTHMSQRVVSPEDLTIGIHGTRTVMGDYLSHDETGVVFVLEKDGTPASATTYTIVAPEIVDDGGMFGYSVDIYEDRLIVGAPFGFGEESGSAFVYQRAKNGEWELEWIFPPDEEDGPEVDFDMFGESVAMYKDRVAISGYNEFDQVTVFIYQYNPTSESYEEIGDIIVDRHCHNCPGVGVALSFRGDGGLFIAYPRKNEVSFLVPNSLEHGAEYVLVQKIYVDDDSDVDMDQVEIIGGMMVVGVSDDFDTNLVFVYSQSLEDGKWLKVDEIELPPNTNFNPEEDFIDLALSKKNLVVNYGDDKLLWYALDGCDQ